MAHQNSLASLKPESNRWNKLPLQSSSHVRLELWLPTGHRNFFAVDLGSHNPVLSNFLIFKLPASFMFILLNRAKKTSSIHYWLMQGKSKELFLRYYLTCTRLRWKYVLTVQHIFPTEMKLVSRVKIASSCITCPRGPSIIQNAPYLLTLNTARTSKKVAQVWEKGILRMMRVASHTQ